MTDNEKRLLDRAERLRRKLIEIASWLEHNEPMKALDIAQAAIRNDG